MFRVDVNIEVGKYSFSFVNEIEINSSWKDFTQTCTIKMPRKILTSDGKKIQDVFKKGDVVCVKLGYDDNLKVRFEGYLNNIKATIPVELQFEDEMWNLKQQPVKPFGFKSATVEDVLQYIGISNFETLGNIDLGAFQIDANIKSVVGVFDKIKKDYGINFFFRNNILIAGKPYGFNPTHHIFTLQERVIENNLEYKTKDEIKVKVRAISNYDDGSRETVELGDNDGETHTLNYYNLSKVALKAKAETEIDLLKYEGYRGSMTIFGEPHVMHGDVVQLIDKEYPERSGAFYVDKVVTTLSTGLRQMVELGKKAS